MSDDKSRPAPARPARKVSAFALAKIDFSVRAEIGVDDVKTLRPSWTEQEAQAFLRDHGDIIGTEMAMAGAIALAALLEGGRDVN